MYGGLSLFSILISTGTLLARLLVGGLLLIAGLAKLKAHRSQLLNAILGYDLIPEWVAAVLTRGLPWVEVSVGGLLLVGLWSRLVAILGVGLLLIFSSAVTISLLRGKDNNCGCFGSPTSVQWRLVRRHRILMGLLVPVYILSGGSWALDNWLGLQADWNFQHSVGLVVLVAVWLFMLIASLLLEQLTRQKTLTDRESQKA